MALIGRVQTLIIVFVLVCQARGQTTGNNVPSSPLWPVFSQLLSTQTGRSVQDINTLGLSDPTIKQLWTSYSATLAKMTQTPAPPQRSSTTPPPLPDLYQNSYSFSSSSSNQGNNNQGSSNPAARTSAGAAKTSGTASTSQYNDIVNMINQLLSSSSSASTAPASSPSAPQKTITSAQDVMSAYAQLQGAASNSGSTGSSSSNSAQAMLNQLTSSTGGSTTAGGTDYQALLQKYMSSMGGAANSAVQLNQVSSSAGTLGKDTSNTAPSFQSLVDQYNNIMNSGASGISSSASSTSYEQLLQQYNQIMGGKISQTAPTSTSGNSGGTPSSMAEQFLALMQKGGSSTGTANDQLLQMYAQMMGGASSATNSSTATPAPSPASAQETFEKQLAAFFPQFKSFFPQSSSGNTSSGSSPAFSGSNPAASNTAQMIFDALLFAPPQPAVAAASSATATVTAKAPTTPTETATQTAPVEKAPNNPLSTIQNLVNSGAGSEAMLSNHVQNVFKTRASREMGCRFLPELLELDLLPTAPINCMNRCPFPYVNSQQFGVYCVCCPPGVNEQTVGMMSLVRGTSYMETPLSVVS